MFQAGRHNQMLGCPLDMYTATFGMPAPSSKIRTSKRYNAFGALKHAGHGIPRMFSKERARVSPNAELVLGSSLARMLKNQFGGAAHSGKKHARGRSQGNSEVTTQCDPQPEVKQRVSPTNSLK